jgi:hypothetical protein
MILRTGRFKRARLIAQICRAVESDAPDHVHHRAACNYHEARRLEATAKSMVALCRLA